MKSLHPKSLCVTCKYKEGCGFKKDPEIPSYFCEEFDYIRSPAKPFAAKIPLSNPEDKGEKDRDHHLLGLCINCENRHSCRHSNVEGGVWHCEEYE